LATNNKSLAAIDKTAVVEFPRYPPFGYPHEQRKYRWAFERLAVDLAAKAMELNRRFSVDNRWGVIPELNGN